MDRRLLYLSNEAARGRAIRDRHQRSATPVPSTADGQDRRSRWAGQRYRSSRLGPPREGVRCGSAPTLYSTRVQQRVCIQAHHGIPLRTTERTLTCPTLRLTRGCQYLGVKVRGFKSRRPDLVSAGSCSDHQLHGRQPGPFGDRRTEIWALSASPASLIDAFSKLKAFRAVATRTGKREYVFQGTIDVASIKIWLRHPATQDPPDPVEPRAFVRPADRRWMVSRRS
jgi:hypothetical protein